MCSLLSLHSILNVHFVVLTAHSQCALCCAYTAFSMCQVTVGYEIESETGNVQKLPECLEILSPASQTTVLSLAFNLSYLGDLTS